MDSVSANTPIIDPLAAVPPPIIPKEDNSLGAKFKKITPTQYVSMAVVLGVVGVGGIFLANVSRFSGDVRSRAGSQAFPTATPAFCNVACSDTAPCPAGLKCYDGVCRNPQCWGSSACVCAPMPKK